MKKCTFGLGACAISWLICGVSYVWADNGAVPPPMAPTSSTLPSDMGPSGSALNRGSNISSLKPCLKARRTSNICSHKAGRFL